MNLYYSLSLATRFNISSNSSNSNRLISSIFLFIFLRRLSRSLSTSHACLLVGWVLCLLHAKRAKFHNGDAPLPDEVRSCNPNKHLNRPEINSVEKLLGTSSYAMFMIVRQIISSLVALLLNHFTTSPHFFLEIYHPMVYQR